jgi:hypothetical protein
MEEAMIRGHVLDHAARFCRTSYDQSTASRVEGELSLELKAALDSLSRSEWYPRRYLVEILNALAAVRGSNDGTYSDIVRCGRALADPSDEYTRLLMQVMTPELFLKKLPRFWERDHQGSGAFELEPIAAGEQSARFSLRSVKHYDHAAILWLGFIQGVLVQLGTSGLSVAQRGWSWESPGPQEVTYEVKWS